MLIGEAGDGSEDGPGKSKEGEKIDEADEERECDGVKDDEEIDVVGDDG